MGSIQDVIESVRARQPIVWVNTFEERRLIDEIITSEIVGLVKGKEGGKDVLQVNPAKKLMVWSCTQGLVRVEGQMYRDIDIIPIQDVKTTQPVVALQAFAEEKVNFDTCLSMVLIMRDLHAMFSVPMTSRKLRDIFMHLGRNNKTVVIVGPNSCIPDELAKDVYVVDYDFPQREVIEKIVDQTTTYIKGRYKAEPCKADPRYIEVTEDGGTKKYRIGYTPDEKEAIIRASQGLTAQEILCATSRSVHNTDAGEILYDRVAEEKKNIIKRSEVLEFWTHLDPMSDVGGNADVKDWLLSRGHAVTGKAVDFGVRPPKGCIIAGIPGCGKSLLSKAVAGAWKVPCIRLDMGRIFAGLVGSSEKNMRMMIKQAEAMSPIVLWIDEIEKGLSGTGSSNFSDGGTTSRVFGTFVSWMQDKKPGVFVIATANDVSKLPAELLRKGRFDAIWFVDLPTEDERKEIFATHIRRAKRLPEKFDIAVLAAERYIAKDGRKYDFSGSEIEEAINDALFDTYMKHPKAKINGKEDIDTDAVVAALKKTIPLSCTMADRIAQLRRWGRRHARFASPSASKEHSDETAIAKAKKPMNLLDADMLETSEETDFGNK